MRKIGIWVALAVLVGMAPGWGKAEDAKAYLGRWDLTLKAAGKEYPSWLELKEEGGKLSAVMVGRWGNARPLPSVELKDGSLTFVSPKEEEGSDHDLVFTGTYRIEYAGKAPTRELVGTLIGPDGKTWQWTGVRAPKLDRVGEPKWGEPVKLFDGRDLAGWKMNPADGTPRWTVQDGLLVSPGHGPELQSEAKFQDFKLHVEFNCGKDANSGVYLRGRYEVQIETESQDEPPSHHTGGVYGFLPPDPEQPRTPDSWQTFDITLIGRMVTVVQNGKTVIDHREIPGITGGAVDSHEGEPGPIYLQGSEKGHVEFRNIVITPGERTGSGE
jgi:hypothetical protein